MFIPYYRDIDLYAQALRCLAKVAVQNRKSRLNELLRRYAMLVTHKHHHLDWGTYLIMTGLLGGLVIFAGILLKDCATMLTWTTGGG